jgi:hypothetical protein
MSYSTSNVPLGLYYCFWVSEVGLGFSFFPVLSKSNIERSRSQLHCLLRKLDYVIVLENSRGFWNRQHVLLETKPRRVS